MSKRFKFEVPLSLAKADENGWTVSGLASTEDKDLQGEIIKKDGIDLSLIKQGKGLLNYEHKNDPEYIVGAIKDAEIRKEGMFVEGYLFKNHKKAQAIAEIMQSLSPEHKKRVQLSVEGMATKRDFTGKVIKNAIIDRVAITFSPVNPNTYLTFAKSLVSEDDFNSDFEKSEVSNEETDDLIERAKSFLKSCEKKGGDNEDSVEKNLSAGDGYLGAPGEITGGTALVTESLDTEDKPSCGVDKKKAYKSEAEEEKERKENEGDGSKKEKLTSEETEAVMSYLMKKLKGKYPEANGFEIYAIAKNALKKGLENYEC